MLGRLRAEAVTVIARAGNPRARNNEALILPLDSSTVWNQSKDEEFGNICASSQHCLR
jgi:hypothetical protein